MRRSLAAGSAPGPAVRVCGAAIVAGLTAALAILAGCGDGPRRPNLLLVTVDTLRADRLACYGGPEGAGARLCGLFEGGIRYRWAFSTAPYTAPSVASLLASRYPAYHCVTQAAESLLPDDATTVAEILGEHGYSTAAFVSNPVLDRSRNLDQGFAVYDQRMTRTERNRPHYAEREARATTDAALAWARGWGAIREPWFLWVHYQDPHGPYEPPAAAPRPGDPPGARRLPVLENHSGRSGIPRYQALPGLFSAKAYERRYLDEIAYLDPHLERLVAGLDALARPPAILLTADHGEAFGEDDYFFAHGHSVGLDQIRVPLLYRPPERGETRVLDAPVSVIDLAPTLLFLAGAEMPASYQGRVLPGIAPIADGASGGKADRRVIFAEHGRRAAAVRGDRFYARDRQLSREDVLIDLGGELPWLPPRRATLAGDGALPDYEVIERVAEEPLESALSEFLLATRDMKGVRHEHVSNEVKERMRALGYLED